MDKLTIEVSGNKICEQKDYFTHYCIDEGIFGWGKQDTSECP